MGVGIFDMWEGEGWEETIMEEDFDLDRNSLILNFTGKTGDKKQAILRKCLA